MIETAIEADEVLEQIKALEAQIKKAEAERDAFIVHYQSKIAAAQSICDAKCKAIREQIAQLTDDLRRYAEINLPADRKSIDLPSGTLKFRKQDPLYFYDELKPAEQDERLLQFVKRNAHRYLKVKYAENVNWADFKRKLSVDGDNVYFTDTGEVIDGLHAQLRPDKFTVMT